MATRRANAYVYATWITKLLAGEDSCRWKLWFRAHYAYDKKPSDFDLTKWATAHDQMVQETAESLRNGDYSVFLEDQNTFRLRNKEGVMLAGRPDILAVREDEVIVVDCKTGKERNSDKIQVMLYMLVLPHALLRCEGKRLVGEVRYKHTGLVRIPPDAIGDEFRQLFREIMTVASGDKEPPRHPSAREC